MSKSPKPSPTRRRPRRVPPPIRSAGEPFEAAGILEEFSGDRAILLWKTARSVELWADLAPEERVGAFLPEARASRLRMLHHAELEAEVAAPLTVAAGVLDGSAEPGEVAEACRTLALWARERGAIRTALQLMQAAALVREEDAGLAIEVGRLARAGRDAGRAESWYRQAISVARRGRDWGGYSMAHLALTLVLKERGNYPAARRTAIRALRAARRHSLHELEGMSHHDLMVLAIHSGAERAVTEHARGALAAYGPRNPLLAPLANDLAYHWMERGYFAAALRVFRSLDSAFEAPLARLFLCANWGRAAGGAGEKAAFEAAWAEAHRWIGDGRTEVGVAAALLDLGHGALSLGLRERARAAAGVSLERARVTGQGHVALQAEALLQAAAELRVPAQVGISPEPAVPEPVEELVEALTAAL